MGSRIPNSSSASSTSNTFHSQSPSLRYRSNQNTPNLNSNQSQNNGMGIGALSPSLFDITPTFQNHSLSSTKASIPTINHAQEANENLKEFNRTDSIQSNDENGYLRKALESIQFLLKRNLNKSSSSTSNTQKSESNQSSLPLPLPLPGSLPPKTIAPSLENLGSIDSVLSSITYNPNPTTPNPNGNHQNVNQGLGLLKPPTATLASNHPSTIMIVHDPSNHAHHQFPSQLISPPLMSNDHSLGKESLFSRIRQFRETTFNSTQSHHESNDPNLTNYPTPNHSNRNRNSKSRISLNSSTNVQFDSRHNSIYTQALSTQSKSSSTTDLNNTKETSSSIDHHQVSLSLFTSLRYANKFPDFRSKSIKSNSTSLPSYDHHLNNSKGVINTPVLNLTEKGQTDEMIQSQDHEKITKFKIALVLSVSSVMVYALIGLIYSLLFWFRALENSDVVQVADPDVLRWLTAASSVCLLTGLTGLTGTILHSRKILTIYNLMLWPSLACVLVIGYLAYKRVSLNLDLKLNQAWSEIYDPLDRLRIQNALKCCGYYNPLHEATFSSQCYPRVRLVGCKGKLFKYETNSLDSFTRVAFWIASLHMLNIVIGLLCSNHVDRQFGKNLIPPQYRLKLLDVNSHSIQFLNQFPIKNQETNPKLNVKKEEDLTIKFGLLHQRNFRNSKLLMRNSMDGLGLEQSLK
ncbi:tetraspanin Tsp2 [Melampsora larici-populina 98AG31]|uniref:Tetraspanin Tsp2 n=1 Tax=Melampsora larici-populina (strain 98AG31 / pathotype 3-4-7) TaxID=747676 RepID=F4R312_MELLP|nr:tetraspanin Tsp2 [Melampsora larici-populina 98AG31]EGG12549.1 tetraspanin Tsp2 [Melampsora larici-populina 98AG31]